MNNPCAILLAEDDPSFGGVLRDYLTINGYSVQLCADGNLALSAFETKAFDLVITDVMMPMKDGFTLAGEMKKIKPGVPFIFLTARTQKEDILRGYKSGADDYILKPFDSEVLLYKIRAVLARQEKESVQERVFRIGKFRVDMEVRSISCEGMEERLSPREAELLELLYRHRNAVLTRQEALKKIWGDDSYFNARSMDVYVTRLRRRMKSDASVRIETVYGTGLKLCVG